MPRRRQHSAKKEEPLPEPNKLGSFLGKHAGTLIFSGVLAATQISVFAVMQNRVSNLEFRQNDYVNKISQEDLARRTSRLETELVPRQEHILRDDQLNNRLKSIEETVHSIDERVNQIQQQQLAGRH